MAIDSFLLLYGSSHYRRVEAWAVNRIDLMEQSIPLRSAPCLRLFEKNLFDLEKWVTHESIKVHESRLCATAYRRPPVYMKRYHFIKCWRVTSYMNIFLIISVILNGVCLLPSHLKKDEVRTWWDFENVELEEVAFLVIRLSTFAMVWIKGCRLVVHVRSDQDSADRRYHRI